MMLSRMARCFKATQLLLLVISLLRADCQSSIERMLTAVSVAPSGSQLVVTINDYGADHTPHVFAFEMPEGKLLWSRRDLILTNGATFSPSGRSIALAVGRYPGQDAVALLLDALTGKPLQAIKKDERLGFSPSATKELMFSADGNILYGLTEESFYAWDVQNAVLMWIRNVPGGPAKETYDAANSFAFSFTGSRLGFNRFGNVYTMQAGRTHLGDVKRLPGSISNIDDQPAFSPDGRYFATGFGYNSSFGSAARRGGFLWRLNGSKPNPISNCGGHFAWTSNPDVFACQNATGTHLRSVQDPNKDIGAAGPPSDLPILKVGNSLWSIAYKVSDWKDPAKPLPLTIVELGTGKRVTVTLPGR